MMQCAKCSTLVPASSRYCLHCGVQVSDPAAATVALGGEQDELLAALRSVLAAEYQIEREIGRGGMAVVYKATEIELARRVALKVLPPELGVARGMSERFKREARLAAALDHPNIIPVHRVGQAGRLLYITMKYVEGRALDAITEGQGPLPVPVILTVLRAAASALAFAHERGIVHRDVKSANILIDTDGRVMVTDFGIARALEDASVTQSGAVMGTPYFMSPEQCAARRIGPQSDQYSLGVVAFQMLTGFVPFSAETLPGIMHHHFYTPVPRIQGVRDDVPQALLDVVSRILAKRPEHRYATTDALLAALEGIPFPDDERRQAESLLRDLARGTPLRPIRLKGDLPTLPDATRLMPTFAALRRHVSVRATWSVAAAAAALFALGGLWWSSLGGPIAAEPLRAEAAPLPRATSPVTPAAAAPRAQPRDSARANRTIRRDTARPRHSPGSADSTPQLALRSTEAPPPTPTPVQAPIPAPPGEGKVRLRAYPTDAEIFIDGASYGRGLVIDSVLRAGERRLRVTAAGYEPFDTTFVVRDGETAQLPRVILRTAEAKP